MYVDLSYVSVTWAISISAAIILIYFLFLRRNPMHPPCPLRVWPIVGNLFQLNSDPREQFAKFRNQCGDIYSLYMGPTLVVVLNGIDLMKETFIKRGDEFSDKATIFLDIASDGVNRGVASASGDVWKEHKAFATSMLKNVGLGKNILGGKIQEEINNYMELIESFKGEPRDVHSMTAISVSNIICSLIVGHRYDYDDKEFHRMQELIEFNLSKMKGTAILNYFPWLRYLPGDLFYCKIIEKNFREFYEIIAGVHEKENEDVVGEPGNLIAAYLQEMKRKKNTHEKTCMDKPNMLRLILDLFLGGTETSAATLLWVFLFMINYPHVQEKIFQEIKEVVGLQRAPTMQDRAKLTYTTATIMEVQRLVYLLPLSIPRALSHDIYLRGYFIPKGAQILMNFESVMSESLVWGNDAGEFRPDRFITEDGSITTPEAWTPFSIGRRACLGEGMAKMELFLYVSNIIQRFHILPEDPERIPPLKGRFQITHNSFPYNVRFVYRKSH